MGSDDAAARLLTEVVARYGSVAVFVDRVKTDPGADTVEMPRIGDGGVLPPASGDSAGGRHRRQ